MAIRLRSVDRSRETIRFGSRLDDRALKGFMEALEEVLSRGYEVVVLDLRKLQSAYADSVLPLVCLVEEHRERGRRFRIVLPIDEVVRRLFVNSGWAALLDPNQPAGPSMHHPQQLPVRRYQDRAEQESAVHEAIDIVLRSMKLRRDAIRALEWTVNEITDNVLNHAQTERGGLVQVNSFTENHKIKLVVADGGRGIPVAMRESFPQLSDDEALTEAMKPGVTSPRDAGQGNGLAGSARIAEYARGSLKILSGRAGLSVFKDPRGVGYKVQKTQAPGAMKFLGTTVMVELDTSVAFDIEEALALDGRRTPLLDVVDLRYATQEGFLQVRICDESYGVGTRHAGAELRRKCLNLLEAEPRKRVVLDWEGIPLISSSFADEAVGKLFVELGFSQFTARVGHSGAEPLVASLIDRAVTQRVSQHAAAVEQDAP
jgi:anti-sigma regulatory factor (Ser/Thr protein kinase)/anti-anti-sigma regulatory factor